MNIEEFTKAYPDVKDIESITIKCDHPLHEGELVKVGKQAARRNILKHGGKEFICRDCYMRHSNPMNHEGERRQTEELIIVYCPLSDHEGENGRSLKKSHYYGEMKEPYLQICSGCSKKGRTISEEQRKAISEALTGVKRSDEFKKRLSDYMKNHPEGIERARNLIEHRGAGMLGRSHTHETREKQSKRMKGRKYTVEHRNNIAAGRKRMLQETGGFAPEHKERLRQAAIEQYARGFNPREYNIEGWHDSPKAGRVFYRSSYECKAFEKLDNDEAVETYAVETTKLNYVDLDNVNRVYIVDIDVKYKDGSIKLVEVKPAKLVKETVLLKRDAAVAYCESINAKYEIWSETELFGAVYNESHIVDYAKKLRLRLASKDGISLTEEELKMKIRDNNNERAKRHYHNTKVMISVHCDFCGIVHEIRKEQYENNKLKNGRYICIKENGSLQGAKPKTHLQDNNPYAADGKKQCNKCDKILLLENFSKGKAICKECRSSIYNQKYHDKKQS